MELVHITFTNDAPGIGGAGQNLATNYAWFLGFYPAAYDRFTWLCECRFKDKTGTGDFSPVEVRELWAYRQCMLGDEAWIKSRFSDLDQFVVRGVELNRCEAVEHAVFQNYLRLNESVKAYFYNYPHTAIYPTTFKSATHFVPALGYNAKNHFAVFCGLKPYYIQRFLDLLYYNCFPGRTNTLNEFEVTEMRTILRFMRPTDGAGKDARFTQLKTEYAAGRQFTEHDRRESEILGNALERDSSHALYRNSMFSGAFREPDMSVLGFFLLFAPFVVPLAVVAAPAIIGGATAIAATPTSVLTTAGFAPGVAATVTETGLAAIGAKGVQETVSKIGATDMGIFDSVKDVNFSNIGDYFSNPTLPSFSNIVSDVKTQVGAITVGDVVSTASSVLAEKNGQSAGTQPVNKNTLSVPSKLEAAFQGEGGNIMLMIGVAALGFFALSSLKK
jgi:hypothetical protein